MLKSRKFLAKKSMNKKSNRYKENGQSSRKDMKKLQKKQPGDRKSLKNDKKR